MHARAPLPRPGSPWAMSPALLALALGAMLGAAACQPERKPSPRLDPPEGLTADVSRVAAPRPAVVTLRGGSRLGVPLHALPRTRRVSGRLPAGTKVRILAERDSGRWLQIQGPGGTTGWITSRYVDWRGASGHLTSPPRPPGQAVSCPLPAPGPAPRLGGAVAPVVAVGPERAVALPRRITVASYNVWELYDGVGADRYLSRHHGDRLTPADVKVRVGKLAAELRKAQPHVIAFQEIENAQLACDVARLAVPNARWRCGAGAWTRRGNPQNVAVASRIGGTITVLTPQGRFAPRGVVELSALGGRLRVLAVHLKSSRGARGRWDCRNAARREAMARAIVTHLEPTRATSAALVTGDFNFDPLQALHDRTDDRLLAAGLRSLRLQFYPRGAPSTYPGFRSTIDLAFFRPAAGIRAAGYQVLTEASTGRWVSDHRPILVTLERP